MATLGDTPLSTPFPTGVPDPVTELFGAANTAFEFDTSSLAGLTFFGAAVDVENADTSVPDCYFIRDDNTGDSFSGRFVASPATPFTVITKVVDSTVASDFSLGGLVVGVAAPGAGAFNTWGVLNASRTLQRNGFVTPTNSGGGSTSTGQVSIAPPLYLAIRVNSTTSLDFLFSYSGYVWRKFIAAFNPSLTVGSVGLGMAAENGGVVAMAWDYLRIWNSALTFPGAV